MSTQSQCCTDTCNIALIEKNEVTLGPNGLITLAYSGTGTGDRKNGLYEIIQNISHYTGTGTRTPLFPIVLIPVPVLGPVPE